MQRMIESCFTPEELKFLEPAPEFAAAVASSTDQHDIYEICRIGERLLNPAPRAGQSHNKI
jgi:hypothetical protein